MMIAYLNSSDSHARRKDYLLMLQDYLLSELEHELDLYQVDSTLVDIRLVVCHLVFIGQLLESYS